jgi:hypothetical protein
MMSATLQTWFPSESTFAFAALRSFAALGTAVFCGIGPSVSAHAQFIALIAIFAVAASLFAHVHFFDVSIDAADANRGAAAVEKSAPDTAVTV